MSYSQARETLAALWGWIEDSGDEIVLRLPRLSVAYAGPVLMAALLTVTTPASLEACSKGTFIEVQPELYFVFTALPDTVEAGWSGARGGWQPPPQRYGPPGP